jgi:hypothetical protein
MAKVVDAPGRIDSGGANSGLPFAGAEVPKVDVPTPERREQKRRVETRANRVESVQHALPKRDAPSRALRLPVLTKLSLDVRAVDENDALGAVEVAALKRKPFLGAKPGSGREDGDDAIRP